MPGCLHHLSFAENVYRKLVNYLYFDRVSFMEGNIIPDLATDKAHSHYRKSASVQGFFVPDMSIAKKDLFDINNPVRFGMYCHLYLDYHFIEEFLIPEFIWDAKTMTVTNPRNHKKWDVQTFFSPSAMYGEYVEISQLLIKDGHISLVTIEELPELLPYTGLSAFDSRRDKSWKEKIIGYLSEEKDYHGYIFDYAKLLTFFEKTAYRFVTEVLISENTCK